MLHKNDVWLITGCSKGLGKALAEVVLEKGYRLVATARQSSDLADLKQRFGDAVRPLALDVTNGSAVREVLQSAEETFGRVDVLVNNAGYGYLAAIEEGEDEQVRALMETNVYGPLTLIKAVLPSMRLRRHGAIVNLSSVGGVITFPGVGYYHLSKFALEGFSGSLAQELAPLGIDVMVVEPGAFRTNFRGPGSMVQSSIVIDDYAETAGKSRAGTTAGHGKQQGDPVLGAKAILKALESAAIPKRLVIGRDAVAQIRKHIEETTRLINDWEEVSTSTDRQEPDPLIAPQNE